MTITDVRPSPVSTDRPELDELRAGFRPVFDRIAEGAVEREQERRHPFEQIEWLRASGFTAVTVPTRFGGAGATPGQLFRLLVELAAADSNVPQILRAHFALVEQLQTIVEPDRAEPLLRDASRGVIFGNASHERNSVAVGVLQTTAVKRPDGAWVLNGRKAYSTGSLFADFVFVPATTETGTTLFIVPADAPGVELLDDWDGFGQRLTGSGTTIFRDVILSDDDVVEAPGAGPTHMSAFVQLVLLAAIVGTGRAAVADATDFVASRTRVYSHGIGSVARQDPLVQQVLGRLASASFAAESTFLAAADALDVAHDAIVTAAVDEASAIERAELLAIQAQLAVIDIVLPLTTQLFEVGGASATSETRRFDRHWRNARTLSSHNPAIYQARAVGDHLANGTPLQYFWATGEGAANGGAA